MSLQQSGFFNWSLKAIVEKSLKGKVEIKSTEEIKLQQMAKLFFVLQKVIVHLWSGNSQSIWLFQSPKRNKFSQDFVILFTFVPEFKVVCLRDTATTLDFFRCGFCVFMCVFVCVCPFVCVYVRVRACDRDFFLVRQKKKVT